MDEVDFPYDAFDCEEDPDYISSIAFILGKFRHHFDECMTSVATHEQAGFHSANEDWITVSLGNEEPDEQGGFIQIAVYDPNHRKPDSMPIASIPPALAGGIFDQLSDDKKYAVFRHLYSERWRMLLMIAGRFPGDSEQYRCLMQRRDRLFEHFEGVVGDLDVWED